MDRSLSTLLANMPTEKPLVLKKPIVVKFPKRIPSLVIPKKEIVYISADKTTCAECECFPKESPYRKPQKLTPCLMTPLTLYELAALKVDRLWKPDTFMWSVEEVAKWMEEVVGLPQYRRCIIKNQIDGMRLLMLEDPSNLPKVNIHIYEHITTIVKQVRELFSTEVMKFYRSVGLPPRLPLTHCKWFHSRTGPSWGIRQNWTRSDVLRWMKIINPEPLYLDHWDLVWYEKPDFPKTMFARIPKAETAKLPFFRQSIEYCNEYEAPRKFKIARRDEDQYIWMEHLPGSPSRKRPVQYLDDLTAKAKIKKPEKPRSRLERPKITLEGLTGKDLLLARRLMPKQKFLA